MGEERETVERRQGATESEAEEMAFKLKVAAVIRRFPKAKRFALTPYPRFRLPAVGGGAIGCMDVQLHMYAVGHGAGVPFTFNSLRAVDENGRWFVPRTQHAAITRRLDITDREPRAPLHSWQGGWRLIDELPDTDQLSGVVMDSATFASRWRQDPKEVLKHLFSKH